jgi:hypothetical protein
VGRAMIKRPRRSHIFAKETHGHYVEPAWCSARLFASEDFGPAGSVILDPACGWGRILTTARAAGYRAIGTDIVDRSGGLKSRFECADFLNGFHAPEPVNSIVCNPPFDHVAAFCRRACEVAQYKVAMICLLRRLPAAHWLGDLPLETVYLLSPRPSMPPGEWIAAGNKPGGGKQDFCWLVFNVRDRSRQEPVMRWLHREAP